MNQIFGYQLLSEDTFSNSIVFDGTQSIQTPMYSNSKSPQVRLFAHPHSHVQTYFSQENALYAYVWGIPAHPQIAQSDIAAWCAQIVAQRCYERFRELLGFFVVIVDEPRRQRISFITDVLGVRPIFLAKQNGRIIFGSDVWPIQKAGLIRGIIDYDAVTAWIAYGYNCTDGSLFAELSRLPPGSVVVFQDGQRTECPYARLEAKSQIVPAEKASEDLHEIVLSTVKTLLANHPRVSIALSGGYDSRYLLALCLLSLPKTSIDCATVGTIEEGHIAYQVAEALGVSLKDLPVRDSVWDLYDHVYHFTADGFPISKFVTYCIAQQYPGIPMVNGFLGDSLMRGSHDRFLGKLETEWSGNLADTLQRQHFAVSFDIFREDIAKRIQMRSRVPMEQAVQKGSHLGRVVGWTDLYYRKRYYISNNFIQHIDQTEALLPFYSLALISYKMSYDYSVFNRDIYHRVFHSHFQAIASIPHASDLPHKQLQPSRVAKCIKLWARHLPLTISNKNWLSLLSKNRCMLLAMAGMVGYRPVVSSIMAMQRLYLLEQRMRDAALDFNWECI